MVAGNGGVAAAVNVACWPEPGSILLQSAETVTVGLGVKVMLIVFELEVIGAAQARLEVITTYTASPLAGTYVYTLLLGPTLPPFTTHWYDGVPPLTGVAVNVTGLPAHNDPDETMLTEAAREPVTVMVMALLVAGLPDGQVALEVSMQVTISLLLRVAEV